MKTISGGVTAPQGFKAGGTACGIKKNQLPDLAIIYSQVPAAAAGIFTTNRVQAAPVILSREYLKKGKAQAIIGNSGNANACVGAAGMEAARRMAAAAGKALDIPVDSVLVASTGVIGVPLPVEKIEQALAEKADFLTDNGSPAAARAIMTTDTFPKEAAVEFELGGETVRIGGIAKGSGMIHPNMATMFGFITTDARIEQALLQKATAIAGKTSFNRISVDGDTSTNDCLFVLANGLANNEAITSENQDYQVFLQALTTVCLELAKMIARDGEGATKLVEIKVSGGKTEEEAVKAGKSVATSNLVKTALFGEDANWGRILAAVGYSGVAIDPDRVSISLGDLPVYQKGVGLVFDETKAKQILSQKEIIINIDLSDGKETASVWTCDLSYDYVKINGSYRS
ncbi:MAG: bifunctional glutamate N-acetyltransferase/amino-acid acetyltransferase ArgJ [Bacteroidota bacterium]